MTVLTYVSSPVVYLCYQTCLVLALYCTSSFVQYGLLNILLFVNNILPKLVVVSMKHFILGNIIIIILIDHGINIHNAILQTLSYTVLDLFPCPSLVLFLPSFLSCVHSPSSSPTPSLRYYHGLLIPALACLYIPHFICIT